MFVSRGGERFRRMHRRLQSEQMRRGNADMHKNRQQDHIFLCLYLNILRCGKAVFGKLVYKLRPQCLVRLSGRSGRKRFRRMREAGLLQQFRLRCGETVRQCRNDFGVVPELRREFAMHVSQRTVGQRFGRMCEAGML